MANKKRRKKARIGICRKCNTKFYVHAHHVLPKSIFGKDGKTEDLCPNCHTHFHEYRLDVTKDFNDKEEAETVWSTWLNTISTIITVSLLVFCLYYFS